MKARHVVALLLGAGLLAWTLASCDLATSVSISERIKDFQGDLNTSDRANLYQNFHPTETLAYAVLKNPSAISGFNALFPVPGTSYALSIVDDSNKSAVIVQVTAGPLGTYNPTTGFYLRLKMDTTGTSDYRIVTLDASNSSSSGFTNFIQ